MLNVKVVSTVLFQMHKMVGEDILLASRKRFFFFQDNILEVASKNLNKHPECLLNFQVLYPGTLYNFSKIKEYNYLYAGLWRKKVTFTLIFIYIYITIFFKQNQKITNNTKQLSNNQSALSNNTTFSKKAPQTPLQGTLKKAGSYSTFKVLPGCLLEVTTYFLW